MTTPEPSNAPSPARRRAVFGVAALFSVAAIAAYHNTFSAPFVLDDGGSILENATIRHLWPPWAALSPPANGTTVTGRPVVNVSLALNYAISGEAVWSYHALNLAIHFLAACTLFGFVRRTLELPRLRPRFGEASANLAALIAGLWLLHPLQTESVTYVSQRAESLAGLFVLLTFYGFVRANTATSTVSRAGWYAVSCGGCLLGVAAKETAAVVPPLIFVYDLVCLGDPTRRPRQVWRDRRGYYAALVAVWVVLVWLAARAPGRGGTAGFDSSLAPLTYLQSQFHAIAVYLQLAVWPAPLVFDYGPRVVRDLGDVWPQALLLAALLAGTVAALGRRSPLGFVGAWFFAFLAPSSSIVPIASQTMAEHRIYLPLAAVATLAVIGGYRVSRRFSLVLWPLAGIALGVLTAARNETYASDLTLWRDTVAKAPANARAHYSLGVAYSQRGQHELAIVQDRAALNVDAQAGRLAQHVILTKLGYDLMQAGRPDEAVVQIQQALQIRPNYGRAQRNLAEALMQLGRRAEAIAAYEATLRLQPDDAASAGALASALLQEGRTREAVQHYQTAVRLTPGWAPGLSQLAYALLLDGRTEESIAAYRDAVRLDPRQATAWMGLGYALISARQATEAIEPCRRAVELQPESADAHNTLGIALAQTGSQHDAIAHFEQALRLKAGAADVYNNLGNALAEVGRTSEAIAQYRAALVADPDYAPAHRNLARELRRAGQEIEAARHRAAAERLEAAVNAPQ